jgi:hypothetical protein
LAEKEALERKLDHVLGIDLMSQPGVEVPQGQRDERMGEAPEELLGRGVVPALQAGQEFSAGIRHGWRPACS